MKILHICLSNYYVDGFSYQENELVAQNVLDDHQVKVIASTETFGKDRQLIYVEPTTYLGGDGAEVIRLPYRRLLPHFVMRKLRMHPGLSGHLTAFNPDVILFHGGCGWELNTVANHKKQRPETKLYVDSHEDFNNSARTWASKWLLHFVYYRTILRRNLKRIDRILCVNMSAMSFMNEFYGVPASMLEFFPLGGKILTAREFSQTRRVARELLELRDENILFIQSGKMDRSKKLLESLEAFSRLKEEFFRFIIVGHLHEDISNDVRALIKKDSRIVFAGWKSPDELRNLLCAADVYVQPGTQSATMQMSLCCHCAVILDDVPSHKPFVDGNGWLIGPDLSLEKAFQAIARQADNLPQMSERSAAVASRLLDYRSLAARLYR